MDDDHTKAMELTERVFERDGDNIRKRRIQDSSGIWHEVSQTNHIFFEFDDLLGLTGRKEEKGVYSAAAAREKDTDLLVMDETLLEMERTGLPLDLCFQTVVLKMSHDALLAEVAASRAIKDSEGQE